MRGNYYRDILVLFVAMLLLCAPELLYTQSLTSSKINKSRNNSWFIDSANYYKHSNPALAFDYVEKALEVSIKESDRFLEGLCYRVIGEINYGVQQYDLAVDNYSKSAEIFKKLGKGEEAYKSLELRAAAYKASNDLEESEKFYKESAVQAQASSDMKRLKKSKKNLAEVYRHRGEEKRAIEELEEVRELDIESGDVEEQIATNIMLTDAYIESEPDKALELTVESEALAAQVSDTGALLRSLDDRAEAYSKLGRHQERLSTLQQSREYRKQQKDLPGQSEDNIKISEVLIEQEQIDDAIAYLEESIELSNIAGHIETKKKALKQLSVAYDKAGDYTRAYDVYKQYVEASEKSALQREQKILENLELMQSLTKRLQRIDMLENQKMLNDRTILILQQETELARKAVKQQRIIIVALLLVMSVLFFGVYLVYRSSKQKRIANQLLALRSLRSQMNPHFIFNALNSVNNYISKSDERSANKYLSDFSRLMRAVMENSKHDFVALSSEVQIIELYLKLEHHRFKDKFDYTFSVDPEIDKENVLIPPMMIQPYIENAVWHGLRYIEGKGYLKVEIVNSNGIRIIIEDNGIGRKKSMELKTRNQQQTVSTGLKNITDRLDIINQAHNTNMRVNIEDLNPENGSGTRVTIQITQPPNKE